MVIWQGKGWSSYGILRGRVKIKHKGLRILYEKNDRRRLPSDLLQRIEDRLAYLDKAVSPENMNLPGYHLHKLSGERRGQWSIRVSGNWRIVFRFEDSEAVDVDLVDYH